MNIWKLSAAAAAMGALACAVPAVAQSDQGQGTAVVTVMGKKQAAPPAISQGELKVSVNGKDVNITHWAQAQDGVELIMLIDGGARTSIGRQLDDMTTFIQTLPPNVKIGVAYMMNGQASISAPLTLDHARAAQAIRITGGVPGENASPYFCLSDLAKRWPSRDPNVRREVVMITDGVDNYDRRFDPEDPYVQAAIDDSVRAGLVVYSIYYQDTGRMNSRFYETNAGQSLLLEVTEATGGNTYWQGYGNPVSFQPYLQDLNRRLQSQYELGFEAKLKGKPEVENLKLKVNAPGAKVDSPQNVLVAPAGAVREQ